MSDIAYWNTTMDLDKPGLGAGHVRQSLLKPDQETGYVRIFWQVGLKM
jgi:hypothetical protein